jgi:hypothetical protein
MHLDYLSHIEMQVCAFGNTLTFQGDYVKDGDINICKVHTDFNIANPFDKLLPRENMINT